MNKKYLKYSLENLLDDKDFILWALRGTKNEGWEDLLKLNNEFGKRALKGKEIILLLRESYKDKEKEQVSGDRIIEMWQNIDLYNSTQSQKKKSMQRKIMYRWAASILILLSIGAFGYYSFQQNSKTYQFADNVVPEKETKAKLILSSGESIQLEANNSKISLTDKELAIDNDSIIDLAKMKVSNKNRDQLNEVIVPFGKKSELLLADGTKVWLNAGSRLAFPSQFTKKNRAVFLEGEAYFEVSKIQNQPFIVNAGELNIRVLGTSFDVLAYPTENRIETILLEGSVIVSKPNIFGFGTKDFELKPSQKAIFNKVRNEVSVFDEPNADVYIAWTEGWLQFSKESLQSVFTKLERFYDMEIVIHQDFPSSELITGKLDLKDSLEEVMLALSDVAKIEFQIKNKRVLIEKKN